VPSTPPRASIHRAPMVNTPPVGRVPLFFGTSDADVPTLRPLNNRAPPGRAPPPRRVHTEASLPSWIGPQPPPDMKALRVVNWQPIRKPNSWEGSVWQQVHSRMQEEGFEPLPESELTRAFMRKVQAPLVPKMRKVSVQRALPARTALATDLLHAQLVRQGITSPRQLRWATGDSGCHDQLPRVAEKLPGQAESPDKSGLPGGSFQNSPLPSTSAEARDWEDEEELPGDLLELVLGLLKTGSSASHHLCKEGRRDLPAVALDLPPSEEFLSRLMLQAGPLQDLQHRVEMALHIARFPSEAADLARQLSLGIDAVDAVLGSSVLPALLEGVLLLGNYVNASSKTLGGAVGVTLESLAKLAHTRCLPDNAAACEPQMPHNGKPADQPCHARVQPRRSSSRRTKPQQPDNALHLLVRQLQGRCSHFARQLTVDLELCSKARDLDTQALAAAVNNLGARVRAVEHHVEGVLLLRQIASGRQEPRALRTERLRSFLDMALPEVCRLQELADKLHSRSAALRQYFGEPDNSSLTGMFQCLTALWEALPCGSTSHQVPLSPDLCQVQQCPPSKECLVTSHQQHVLETPPRRPARAVASPPPLPRCNETIQHEKPAPAVGLGSEPTKPQLQSVRHHQKNNTRFAPVARPPILAAGKPTGGKTQDAVTLERAEFSLQVDAALRI